LWGKYDIQIILEEWSDTAGDAIGHTLETEQLYWRDVGTPDKPEYKSFVGFINNNYDPEQPKYTYFREYAFEIHEKREQFMLGKIMEYMTDRERGLLILGMAHIHSMMDKLRKAGFKVSGGTWLQMSDKEKTSDEHR
jgi:hypothetical protein